MAQTSLAFDKLEHTLRQQQQQRAIVNVSAAHEHSCMRCGRARASRKRRENEYVLNAYVSITLKAYASIPHRNPTQRKYAVWWAKTVGRRTSIYRARRRMIRRAELDHGMTRGVHSVHLLSFTPIKLIHGRKFTCTNFIMLYFHVFFLTCMWELFYFFKERK